MKRSLLLSLCAVAIVAMSLGQAMAAISLSLNLRYNDPADVTEGGTWDLLAKTDSANGISGLVVVLDNITFGSTTFNNSIVGIPIETSQSGTLTEIVWGYDVNATAGVGKFANVGKGNGSPGNVAKDDLFPGAANSYDNMALIMSGAFGAVRPSFGTLPGTGGGPTAGQEWTSAAMTAGGSILEVGTGITLMGGDGVRGDSVAVDGLKQGDANRDGIVNTGDLSLLLANFNAANGTWGQGNFNDDAVVNTGDLSLLLANFNGTTPSPAITAVPEPSSALLALFALSLGAMRRRA